MSPEKDPSLSYTFGDPLKWKWNRRKFLKTSLLAGLFSHSVFNMGCEISSAETDPLSKTQFNMLKTVQNILFPTDDIGPGAGDFNAGGYVVWVLNDPRIDQDEKIFFLNGLARINTESREVYRKSFLGLNSNLQKALVDSLSEETWGENWLSLNLSYIFEAMISDPVYGFNDQEQGWEWLDHHAGQPRPDEHTRYDEIFSLFK